MHPNSYSGYPCPYCGRLMDRRSHPLSPTRDHVIPMSRGGRAKIICCRKCNMIKADMMPEVWAAYMAANPGWWAMSRAERRARRRQAFNVEGFQNGRPAPVRQGAPPVGPITVPSSLIYISPEEL